MKELRTETVIEAKPETVWQVLTDFYSYSQWSRFITRIEGDPVKGGRLNVVMKDGSGKNQSFKPVVLVSEPEREFRWKGKLKGMGWLFSGEHFFIIEKIDEERTKFVHGELFTGFLVPMLWKSLNTDTRQGFLEFNKSIKKKAESLSF